MLTGEQAVDGINRRFGRHVGARALHAKGIVCEGSFVASETARSLSRAAHMQGDRVPVTVRLSNGSGDPRSLDYEPDVRGLATTFHLPDGSRTDISAQTVPHFPVRTPDEFIQLVELSKPSPAALWRLPLFLARHPRVVRTMRANAPGLKPPPSFANCSYYAIHAFRWIDATGAERYVRYTWRPDAGEERLSVRAAKSRGGDYLHDEIRTRLGREPVRFRLELELAGPGDDPDDPTSTWTNAERVTAGTLELTGVTDEGADYVFDPARITDGIELSADPVLNFRPKAYDVSATRRLSKT